MAKITHRDIKPQNVLCYFLAPNTVDSKSCASTSCAGHVCTGEVSPAESEGSTGIHPHLRREDGGGTFEEKKAREFTRTYFGSTKPADLRVEDRWRCAHPLGGRPVYKLADFGSGFKVGGGACGEMLSPEICDRAISELREEWVAPEASPEFKHLKIVEKEKFNVATGLQPPLQPEQSSLDGKRADGKRVLVSTRQSAIPDFGGTLDFLDPKLRGRVKMEIDDFRNARHTRKSSAAHFSRRVSGGGCRMSVSSAGNAGGAENGAGILRSGAGIVDNMVRDEKVDVENIMVPDDTISPAEWQQADLWSLGAVLYAAVFRKKLPNDADDDASWKAKYKQLLQTNVRGLVLQLEKSIGAAYDFPEEKDGDSPTQKKYRALTLCSAYEPLCAAVSVMDFVLLGHDATGVRKESAWDFMAGSSGGFSRAQHPKATTAVEVVFE